GVDVEKVRKTEDGTMQYKVRGWEINGTTISAKVMNPLYKLERYKLTRDTEEGCVDVLVILGTTMQHRRGTYWRFTGKITDAKSIKGIRSKVYYFAMMHLGIYNGNKAQSIFYPPPPEDEFALMINIIFRSEENALKFQSELISHLLNFDRDGSPAIARLNGEKVEATITTIDSSPRILATDYVPSDSDSVQESISQSIQTDDLSFIDFQSELMKFQSVEDPARFAGLGGESCHLISRSDCHGALKKYNNSDNNRLCLTRQFHGFFDGIGNKWHPLVRVSVLRVEKFRNMDGRYPVQLKLEFLTEAVKRELSMRLKSGCTFLEKTFLGTNPVYSYSVVVHVLEHTEFCYCVNWKYEHTTKLWQQREADEAAVAPID
ncbi:hypothetical protein HK098_006952, partial [Nowakowskiella sp. JEL0407]